MLDSIARFTLCARCAPSCLDRPENEVTETARSAVDIERFFADRPREGDLLNSSQDELLNHLGIHVLSYRALLHPLANQTQEELIVPETHLEGRGFVKGGILPDFQGQEPGHESALSPGVEMGPDELANPVESAFDSPELELQKIHVRFHVPFEKGENQIFLGAEVFEKGPFRDLGFATVDTHRALRCGVPEVVFCPGKTPAQVAGIAERLLAEGCEVLATRAEPAIFEAVRSVCPEAEYHEAARAIVCGRKPKDLPPGSILVVSAGTSDIPVAEEARVTAEVLGNRVEKLYDVGVAGIHRLLQRADHVFDANVLIVVAGMEGALASVVGGLARRPVIAVPTSIGYGASFGGLAALLAMLNSCASSVCVVNIDNGFGAGYVASLINHTNLPGPGRSHSCPSAAK